MNLTKAIPAGSYFALIRSEEQEVSLVREIDGRARSRAGALVQAAPPYSVQDFEVAPGGQRLFCTLKDIRRGADDVVLAVCQADGAVRTFEGFSQVFASWLFDGRHLLVRSLSSQGDRATVSLIDVTTGQTMPLETPADVFSSHGLYDPEFLISFKKLDAVERVVMLLDPQGQESALVKERYDIRELRFSPDRTKLAYLYSYPYHKWLQGWRIVVVDVKTRGKSVVFDAVAESIFRLRWAPDSAGLSFVCGLPGIPDNRLMDLDLYETMGGFAPDLMGNAYVAFSMKMDGSERSEVARDSWKFDWVTIPDFEPAVIGI